MIFKPKSAATAIGSFPHLDVEQAWSLISETIPDIPVWPQLPKRSFYEEMNNQFSKSLPCYFIDEKNNKSGFNTAKNFPEELEKFYSRVMEDDLDYFGFDEKYSRGFPYFSRAMDGKKNDNLLAIKGHITGPLTLGLTPDITDGKYTIYKPDLFDVIVKNCIMCARWQLRKLKEIFTPVIIFFDEPSLTVIGSGYFSIEHDLVINSFNEIIKSIKDEGGIAGTHCCGNTDWEDLLDLDLDIINFDATDSSITDKFLNSRNITKYLEKGKIIAWGIIPTIKEKIEIASIKEIENSFYSMVKKLSTKGIKEDDILAHSIITPSCGTGPLSVPLSEKALRLTKELSERVRGK